MKIEEISMRRLMKDRKESLIDIHMCETALGFGVTTYRGESVKERLEVNKKIVERIDAEIMRRKLRQWRQVMKVHKMLDRINAIKKAIIAEEGENPRSKEAQTAFQILNLMEEVLEAGMGSK